MSFKQYTDVLEKTFDGRNETRAITVDGEMTISIWDGVQWIITDTLTTGAHVCYTKNLRLKFTPLSGSFSINED